MVVRKDAATTEPAPGKDSLQTTGMVFMVEPNGFRFNEETAATNPLMKQMETDRPIAEIAMEEFAGVVDGLTKAGVDVVAISSRKDMDTPDAVFPNNWFSVHRQDDERLLVLYPMLNQSRQAERRPEELVQALAARGITIDRTIDLTHFEKEGKALEGTGSLIIDRDNGIVYASLSPRTNVEPLQQFCEKLGMSSVVFESDLVEEASIYHTNILMSIGRGFAVVCAEVITHDDQRARVLDSLSKTGKEIIEITRDQAVLGMCGNILELQNAKGEPVILMSQTAFDAFNPQQLKQLKAHGSFVVVEIPTIETVGGGSARCMVCEVF